MYMKLSKTSKPGLRCIGR